MTNNINKLNINRGYGNNVVLPQQNYQKVMGPPRTRCSSGNLAERPRIENSNLKNMNCNPIQLQQQQNIFYSQFQNKVQLSSMPGVPMKKNKSSGVHGNQIREMVIEENFEEEEDFLKFLEKIGDNLVSFIKTQRGSRFMQKFLNKIPPEHISLLLSKMQKDFREIMIDSYGNYFFQKLAQCCSSTQRMYILESVIF
jgi:RNA binding exosome subunit